MYDDHPIEAWRFNISDEGGGGGEERSYSELSTIR